MNSRLPAWMRLTFKGRINRFRYIWYSIGTGLIIAIPSFVFLGIYGFRAIALGDVPFFVILINYALEILSLLYAFSFMIRRLHDLNRSVLFLTPIVLIYIIGWFISLDDILNSSLFPFLILANLFLFIYLYFFKGTEGSNPYGPDPLEYSSYEKYLDELDHPDSLEDHRFDR